MCGRFAFPGEDEILMTFGVRRVVIHPKSSTNVAPTTVVPIVVEDAGQAGREGSVLTRELRGARWGLIPSWAKELYTRPLINARAETVTEKPSFRTAIRSRRAIVPATGYYEWVMENGVKVPYFLHPKDDNTILGFAGLYEWWRVPQGLTIAGTQDDWLCSMAILTRSASDDLGHIHDRMPVVVPSALVDDWLDPTLTDSHLVQDLIHAIPDPQLIAEPHSFS
ncbi:MAG: SOS response-associated peptidase [Propionibacteriaceae bacterium]|nr:SOS response-associated peptidase [Propionibacteriaceae bacterium]